MTFHRALGAFSVFGFAFVAACSNNKATEQDYDDVAAAVGGLVADGSGGGEISTLSANTDVAKGAAPAWLTAQGNGSLQGTYGGLTYAYMLTCKDAQGGALAACAKDVVDSAEASLEVNGQWNTPRRTGTIQYDGHWTIAGLKSDIAEFNGTGSIDAQGEFMALFVNETRTFHFTYDAAYDHVKIRMADRAAIGGEIRYDVHGERTRTTARKDVSASFDIHAVVTFDGSGQAIITLDENRTYHLALATGAVTKQ